MIPYKNQNLDYLHGIEQDPTAYRGKVVSFGGKVKGITEDARRMRLIIKIDVPFYYYATGKDPLSYELLLISFDKKGMPQMTGIQKGSNVKVLARAANFETRKNLTGKPIAVLHLIAFAVADRDRNLDFFRPEPPYKQLYESWKAGRLFFNEQPQEIEERYPAPQRKTLEFFPFLSQPQQDAQKTEEKAIVYDDEEPAFILPPDPKPQPTVKKAKTQPAQPEKPADNGDTKDVQSKSIPTVPPQTAEQEIGQPQIQRESLPNTQTKIPSEQPLPADGTDTTKESSPANPNDQTPSLPARSAQEAVSEAAASLPGPGNSALL